MAQRYKNGDYYVLPAGSNNNYMVYHNGSWVPKQSITLQNTQVQPPPNAPAAVNPASNPNQQVSVNSTVLSTTPIKIGPTTALTAVTLRWPEVDNLTVGSGTDYVVFEFGKYKPPFANESTDVADPQTALDIYNASATAFKPDEGSAVILPMPQDLSTEFRNDWAGKSFTSLGRAAVAALGAGNLTQAKGLANNDIFSAFKDAIISAGLDKIPGVGGNLSMNDISGSTRGVILNPNAEVLYESPNLREIGMVFKMVPQSQKEADNILKICQLFRKSASPSYGIEDAIANFSFNNQGFQTGDDQQGTNYIHVPKLCKFTFMTGAGPNKKIAQYKPCAMTRIDVNYTPDGTYATYSDGTPVAITLSLSFMETKIIFANEISLSGESF